MIKKELSRIGIIALVAMFVGLVPIQSFAGSWNGWIYQDPYPTSLNLFDVKFITPLKGWITGKYGLILYTEDGGDTWDSQESGIEEDIMRVAFVDEKTGWATGERGTIIHTEDSGKTWGKEYDIEALPTKIFFLNEKEGWITGATPRGVVFHTNDGGKSWDKMEADISRAISGIYFINSKTGWILAGEDVHRTTDGGKTWEKSVLPVNLPPMRPLGRMPGGGPTQGTFGITPRGEGLGAEWWFGGITFANEKQGWAAVSRWIFHTEDGGKTWTTQLDTGTMDHGLRHIAFKDAQNGCATGWSIYCTENGGKTWQERLGLGPRNDEMLGGVSLIGQSVGWTVGNGGRILKTEDGGRSWKKVSRGNKCGSVPFFINKKIGWLYEPGDFNIICRTDDGGYTWEKQEIGINVMDVFFINDLTGWAVGIIEEWKDGKETNRSYDVINAWGVIKYTADGGKSWTIQHRETLGKEGYPGLSGVTFINSRTGWVVGKKGTILHTNDGGKHWVHQKRADGELSLHLVQFVDSKTGWITGARVNDGWTGIILHTEDGGKHWNVQHKQRDVGFDDLHFSGKKLGWISGESEYGKVGILLRTEDGGRTWSEKAFENIGYNRMAFFDKNRGVVYSTGVLKTGLMFITADCGRTWSKRRVPLKKYPWHFSEIFEKGMLR